MNALVRIEADRVVADSRDVAADFGKRHDNVLRAIDEMVKTQPDLALNFGAKIYQIETGKGARRAARCFDLDRKGFMLLVMGFNGAKALEVKSRWIDAFDDMERQLLARDAANDAEAVPPSVPTLFEATRICAIAETYRRLWGVPAARFIMVNYGMPEPPREMLVSADAAVGLSFQRDTNVGEWLHECCAADPKHREEASALWRAYVQWCAESQRVPETQTGFGRALSRIGIVPIKASNGRVVRQGVRLLK